MTQKRGKSYGKRGKAIKAILPYIKKLRKEAINGMFGGEVEEITCLDFIEWLETMYYDKKRDKKIKVK